jgi:hypothetical protein
MPALLLVAVLSFMVLPASADPCRWAGGLDTSGTPIGVTQCYDLRPGSPVGGCTLNFVFQGDDGARYMGTAGHCVISGGTDVVFTDPRPVARSRSFRIGEYVYAVLNGERDFALIRLDPDVTVDPEFSHFGGPTGLYTDHTTDETIMYHYGHGMVLGGITPGRTAIAFDTLSETHVCTTSAGVFGDSGSGVIDSTGKAVGVLVTLGVCFWGFNGITRLDYQLPKAEAVLGVDLTLMTAPMRTPV